MTTLYQIRGFAFFDKKKKAFQNFTLYPNLRDPVGPVEHGRLADFLSLVPVESEAYTFYQLTPETGKKHQLRKHLSKIMNTPVLGDKLYDYEAEGQSDLFQKTMQLSKNIERSLFDESICLH
jgi:hypothetical protein